MTKEEAIKFLSETKVYVDGKSKQIQEKLFELDFTWNSPKKYIVNVDHPFLYISSNITISYGNGMDFFKTHKYREITASDILSIKVEKECFLKPFDRVLIRDSDDDEWRAELFSHYGPDCGDYPFRTLSTCSKQCIPYKGNEHLIGTNGDPK